MSVGGGRLLKGVDPSDGAARTDIRTDTPRPSRAAAVGVPLPDRWSRLEARSAWRVRIGAGRSRCTRAGAGGASPGTPDHAATHALRARRDLSGPARRAAGDDREAPLPAQQGNHRLR